MKRANDFAGWLLLAFLTCMLWATPAVRGQEVYSLTTSNDPVKPGQVVEFDLAASDLGSSSTSVYLHFTVPQYTTEVDDNITAGNVDSFYVNGNSGSAGGTGVHIIRLQILTGGSAPPNGTVIPLTVIDANTGATVTRSITIHTAPAINLQVATNQSTVVSGSDYTYTLSYFTLGQSESGGMLAMAIPPGASFVSADNGGTVVSGTEVEWTLGTIFSGSNGQVHVTFEAGQASANGQLLVTQASLTDSGGDVANVSDARVVSSGPGEQYTITTPSDAVKPGQIIEFDITASNLSTNNSNTYLQFTVPQYATYGSDTAGAPEAIYVGGNSESSNGGTGIYILRFQITSGGLAPPNGATITLRMGNQNGPSISRSVIVLNTPVLNLQLCTGQANALPGGDYTYTFAYSTFGQSNLAGGSLSVPVPAGATFVSADQGGTLQGGTVTWPLGTIVAGSNGQAHVTFAVNTGDSNGQLLLTEAALTDGEGDLAQASDTRVAFSQIIEDYALTVPSDPIKPGQIVEFDITASDLSTNNNSTYLQFTVPQYTTYGSDTAGASEAIYVGGNSQSANGGTGINRLFLQLTSGGVAPPDGSAITLNLISSNGSSISRNVVVHYVPALNLQLACDQSNVPPGGDYTDTVSYTTPGQSSLPGATLSIPVPTGASFVSADQGGTLVSGSAVQWNLGTISSGSNGRVHVTFAAGNSAATGELLLAEATLTDAAGAIARASDTRVVYYGAPEVFTLTGPSDQVTPGQTVEFDITASDLGTTGNSTYVSFTVPPYTTYGSNGAGSSEAINVGGEGGNANGGSGINTVYLQVTSGAFAPPDGSTITLNFVYANGASVSRSVVVRYTPTLNLQLATDASTVAPGGDYTYALSYYTPGQANLPGGTLTLPIPAGGTFVSADQGGVQVSGTAVTWNLGTIASGSNRQVHATFAANGDDADGELLMSEAVLSDSLGDIVRASDARIAYYSPPEVFALTTPCSLVAPGQTLEFDLTASDLSTSNQNADVYFTVPPYLTYGNYVAGSNVEVYVGGYAGSANGGSGINPLVFTVTSGAGAPPEGATITLNVIDYDGASLSRSVVVHAVPALNVQMASDASNVPPGGNYSYTISYRPAGLSNLAGGALSLPVPPGTSFVSADGGGTLQSGTTVVWALGTLYSGTNGQVHATFAAHNNDANGELLLAEATLTDSAGDVAQASDARIVYYQPPLSYSLAGPATPVAAGQTVNFTLSTENLSTQSQSRTLDFVVPPYTTCNGYPAGDTLSVYTGGISEGGSATNTVSLMVSSGTAAPPAGAIITLNLQDNDGAAVSQSVTVQSQPPPVIYTITPSAGVNGSISPQVVQTVVSGSSISFIATPSTGYAVNQWLVDGSAVQNGGTGFTLSNVHGNHTVSVTFNIVGAAYLVTPSAGSNGAINPITPQSVPSGGSVGFEATPLPGYGVSQWLVNGNLAQNGGNSFTLSGVSANDTVQVTFVPLLEFFFSNSSDTVENNAGQATLTVMRTRNFTGSASVSYQTLDDSALAGTEYSSATGMLNFTGTQTTATITVPILDLQSAPGSTDFTVHLTNPTGGAVIGTPGVADVFILNPASGDLDLSQTNPVVPGTLPSAAGSITVTLTPPAADGQWRLFGELNWRDSGETATGLTYGNYEIEYKPVSDYSQPALRPVPIAQAQPTVAVTGTYIANGSPVTGALQVFLGPEGTGGWRVQGETAWRAGGDTVSGLNTGDYILEFEPADGLVTPENCEAVVFANGTATVNITYQVQDSATGKTPTIVSSTEALALPPYLYTGMIQTDDGVGTGFVPKDRVVLTAAHVIFDDSRLSFVQGVRWFPNYEAGQYETPPQIPAGSYTLDGYASQRAVDISQGVNPGVATTASREQDVAALFFFTPAARGGQSGYLASDAQANPWLTGNREKFIAGYPVTNVSPTGNLYATPAVTDPFQYVAGTLFSTTALTSDPGNSGGPVFVLGDDGNYYPAAVYLGGSYRTEMHAIDSSVINLMDEAEIAANGGSNNAGGGIVEVEEGVSGMASAALGNLTVTLNPPDAVADGAYWELAGDSTRRLSGQSAALAPGTYNVSYYDKGPGYRPPVQQNVTVPAGSVTPVSATYTPGAPTITSTDDVIAIEGEPFNYQITVTPNIVTSYSSITVLSGLNLALNANTGAITGSVPLGTGTGAYSIYLEASNNEGAGNYLTLNLNVATPGTLTVGINGAGKISKGFGPQQIEPQGQELSITATPAKGNLFSCWSDTDSGHVYSTSEKYQFAMPAVLHLQANFVPNPFTADAGSYVVPLPGANLAESGALDLSVKTKGTLAGTFNLGGALSKLRGAFNAQGQYQGSVDGGQFNVALSLGAGGVLSGTFTSLSDGSQLPISVEKTTSHRNPPAAGTYSVSLPALAASSLPGGSGTAIISKTGGVKFSGRLGDGTLVKITSALDASGRWPFVFAQPSRKGKGAEVLVGTVNFPPNANENGYGGSLAWYRGPDSVYSSGFATTISYNSKPK
jgi:hypothetical protein